MKSLTINEILKIDPQFGEKIIKAESTIATNQSLSSKMSAQATELEAKAADIRKQAKQCIDEATDMLRIVSKFRKVVPAV